MADTSLHHRPRRTAHRQRRARGDAQPLRAPNTIFVYLCTAADGARQVCRVVVRGACTRAHEQRIVNALSHGRYFLRAVAVGDDGDANQALACCELVSIASTLADPSDQRDVEALVLQLEAAALYGWNGRPGPSGPRARSMTGVR